VRLFVGELTSADSTKTNVVTIAPGILGCGRTVNPISFTDMISSVLVGQVREFGISATQAAYNSTASLFQCSNQSQVVTTSMTKFPYRIPFLSQVSGIVRAATGYPLVGVTIEFCHIMKNTMQKVYIASLRSYSSVI
jgi:uncharacterized membrane protein (UPF0182 family)